MSLSRCIRSLAIAFRLAVWAQYSYLSYAVYHKLERLGMGPRLAWKVCCVFGSLPIIGNIIVAFKGTWLPASLIHYLASLPPLIYVAAYGIIVALIMLTISLSLSDLVKHHNTIGMLIFLLMLALNIVLGVYAHILYFHYIAVHIAFFTTLGAGMHLLFSSLLLVVVILLAILTLSMLYTLIATLYLSTQLDKIGSYDYDDGRILSSLLPLGFSTTPTPTQLDRDSDTAKIKQTYKKHIRKLACVSSTLPLDIATQCRRLLYGQDGFMSHLVPSITIQCAVDSRLYRSWDRFYTDVKQKIWGTSCANWGCYLIKDHTLEAFINAGMAMDKKGLLSVFCDTLNTGVKTWLRYFALVPKDNALNRNAWDEHRKFNQYILIKTMLYCFCEDSIKAAFAIRTTIQLFSTPHPTNKLASELLACKDMAPLILGFMGAKMESANNNALTLKDMQTQPITLTLNTQLDRVNA